MSVQGGRATYLGWDTYLGWGRGYLPWLGEGVPTLVGEGVPTLDGEDAPFYLGEGYLLWMGGGTGYVASGMPLVASQEVFLVILAFDFPYFVWKPNFERALI